MSSALAYLHSEGIVHLDVKPGNVFVAKDGHCKLGDYGCSRRLDNKATPRLPSSVNDFVVIESWLFLKTPKAN